MWQFLKQRWFLILLILVIPLGMWLGIRADQERVSSFPKHLVALASGILTGTVLFLMSITLENSKLIQSLRSPGPVLWATFVNYGVLPALTIPFLWIQMSQDLAVGLMITASIPSTMAAASVWTRKAGGNDAVSLLVTIVTNGLCFLVTPLWLMVAFRDSIDLNVIEMMLKLFYTALLPILFGQLMRMFSVIRSFADRSKTAFGAVAQVCILAIVFWASVQGGVKLGADSEGAAPVSLAPLAVVWLSCIVLHVIAIFITWEGGKRLGLRREDVVGCIFAASQKTLPVGIFIAAGLASRGLPFAALPILMFHASQLIIDTLFVEPLKRWVKADSTVNS